MTSRRHQRRYGHRPRPERGQATPSTEPERPSTEPERPPRQCRGAPGCGQTILDADHRRHYCADADLSDPAHYICSCDCGWRWIDEQSWPPGVPIDLPLHKLEAIYRSADDLAALDREIPAEVWYRRLADDLDAPDRELTDAGRQRFVATINGLDAHGLAITTAEALARAAGLTISPFLDRSSG